MKGGRGKYGRGMEKGTGDGRRETGLGMKVKGVTDDWSRIVGKTFAWGAFMKLQRERFGRLRREGGHQFFHGFEAARSLALRRQGIFSMGVSIEGLRMAISGHLI